MLKVNNIKQIDVQDWDELVQETYNRPYMLQQQDGCRDRGIQYITIPVNNPEDYKNNTIPEIVNASSEMGVSFKAWLERDPKQPISERSEDWALEMWWERNFYPTIDMIINDLYEKGLVEAGNYQINIDW
jgi:hypothetical protein